MPHICVSESVQHWSRLWLVAYSAPNHYLSQSLVIGVIVNWTLRNKFQWNFNQNKNLYLRKCIWNYHLRYGGHFVHGDELIKCFMSHYPWVIDPSHKSHIASDKYSIMHHFVTEMCTHVHISVTKCCIVGYGTDAFWDLWDGSIRISVATL